LKSYIHVASLLQSQFAPFLYVFQIAVKCIEPRIGVVKQFPALCYFAEELFLFKSL